MRSPSLDSTLATHHGAAPSSWRRERELFSAWRNGNRQAGHEIVERLRAHLRRFFRARSGGLVDDLVQETLIACVKGRHTLTDGAALKGYVYTAARRILARELERRHHALVELDESLVADDDADVLAEYEKNKAVELLRLQLRTQPTLCTRAAELYFLEGRRGPEIATLLGISEGTVRSRIRRGLGQLRRGLEAGAAA